MRESFGEVLRQFRMAAGLSQSELARRAGLNPDHAYISRLETGRVIQPLRATVLRLGRAMRLTEPEMNRLLALANYRAIDPLLAEFRDEPELLGLARIMRGAETPPELRETTRAMMQSWLRLIEMTPGKGTNGRETDDATGGDGGHPHDERTRVRVTPGAATGLHGER